jgi:hypothetical protein
MLLGVPVFHLLNLLAPAVGVALVLVLATSLGALGRRWRGFDGWQARVGWISLTGSLCLLGCLGWLGRDGKMLAYGLLVLTAALTQAVCLKMWRR